MKESEREREHLPCYPLERQTIEIEFRCVIEKIHNLLNLTAIKCAYDE